jgi:hypothetical protein
MAIGALYRPLLDLARDARVDVEAILRGLELTEAQILEPGTRTANDVDLFRPTPPSGGSRRPEKTRA